MSIVTTDNKFYSEIAAAIREKSGESTLYRPADMAEAILAIKGGGSDLAEAYAIILVEYPAGSTLTCSQPGQDTLVAGNTYGAWAFGVPTDGTWTIHCELGTGDKKQEASEPVVIAAPRQVGRVNLRYALIIHDASTGTSVEWISSFMKVSINETSNLIQFKSDSGSYSGRAYTASKYDLTPYKKLKMECRSTLGADTRNRFGVVTDMSSATIPSVYTQIPNQSTSYTTIEVDVSEIGEEYITVQARPRQNYYVEATKIWAE